LQTLKEQSHYQWILIDLPHGHSPLTRKLLGLCDHTLAIVKPPEPGIGDNPGQQRHARERGD
jgi:cellulose biosynthesis protein BcsQ